MHREFWPGVQWDHGDLNIHVCVSGLADGSWAYSIRDILGVRLIHPGLVRSISRLGVYLFMVLTIVLQRFLESEPVPSARPTFSLFLPGRALGFWWL